MLRGRLAEILRRVNAINLLDNLEKIVRELVEQYKPLKILVTGSLAKGKFVQGLSDIDILVIVEHKPGKHERFQLKAVENIDVEITVFSMKEVKEAIKHGNQFITEAMKEGITIYEAKKKKHAREYLSESISCNSLNSTSN